MPLDVDDLPEALEAEPNDEPAKAATVKLPCVVNGRIDRPGDVDCWRFEAKKGQTVAVAPCARELLGSPLAGVVEVLDDAGKALAARERGALSEILFTAPRDGALRRARARPVPHARRAGVRLPAAHRARRVPDFHLEPARASACRCRAARQAICG